MKLTYTKVATSILILLSFTALALAVNVHYKEKQLYEDSNIEVLTPYQEKLQIIQNIAQDYYNSHTYEKDIFDCEEMSIGVWNALKTQEVNAKICSGNVDKNILINPLNEENLILYLNEIAHVWTMAEIEPLEWVAVESTGGSIILKKGRGSFVNPLYYENTTCFNNPKEYREFNNLRFERSKTCNEANKLIDDWNENYIRKTLTSEDYIFEGKVEAKKEACIKLQNEAKDIIERNLRITSP